MPALTRRLAALLVSATLSLPLLAAPRYVVDGDGDAVSDEVDDCPYTRPGTQVDAKGCPLRRDDADVDGIADDEDSCPYSAAGAKVDTKGCALDGDFDGVADGLDRCTRTGFALVVNASGCAAGEAPQLIAPAVPTATTAVAASVPPPSRMPVAPPASRPAVRAPAPVIAIVPTVLATPPAAAVQATAESPTLLLKFTAGSMRLS